MSINYALARSQSPQQKAKLTRAINSGDPLRVLDACRTAVKEWEEWGAWPDGWARWANAAKSAMRALALELEGL